MTVIREVVQNALTTGYLTIEAEEQLRSLLARKYEPEDFQAFMVLQEAAEAGEVKQESREQLTQASSERRVWGSQAAEVCAVRRTGIVGCGV